MHIQRVWGRLVLIPGSPRTAGSREPGPQDSAGTWVGNGFVPVLSDPGKRSRGPDTETDGVHP